MTTRLFICVAVSTCLHALFLSQPWQLFVQTGSADITHLRVSVRLVEQTPADGFLEDDQEEQDMTNEGFSFEVEGEVSDDYMEQLKVRIFNAWDYPEDAIEKEYAGIVRIAFVLDGSGNIIDIGVLSSSGHYSLDTAAMRAIEHASPFGPFTEDIATQSLKITGNFCYVLD
jgi:TonB family protein